MNVLCHFFVNIIFSKLHFLDKEIFLDANLLTQL